MVFTFEKIKGILRDTWPDLTYIWPRDRQYVLPSLTELNKAILTSSTHAMPDIPGLFECDDRVMFFLCEMARYRLDRYADGQIEDGDLFSWAMGEAVGTFRTSIETHSLVICVCDDRRIYFIEPSDQTLWLADPEIDKPFFVDFH